jgi:uncharacterized protein (TIGR01244 family)
MRKAISQRLSVGGQPQESDLEQLKKDGVTTVVNLRVAGEKSPLTPTEERALAQKLGLQYHHLPISLDKLDATQVKELRKILRENQGPIYVHCGMGQRACSFCTSPEKTDTGYSVFFTVSSESGDSVPRTPWDFFALDLLRQVPALGPVGCLCAATPAVCKAASALEVRPRRALSSVAAFRHWAGLFSMSITRSNAVS